MSNINFVCPVCKRLLSKVDNVLKCPSGHSYDIARQGYCNLLLVDKKHSAMPGDNQLMVNSRFNFLSKGYYAQLSECVCQQINKHFDSGINLLDAGCGYGYYCDKVFESRKSDSVGLCKKDNFFGVDISKFAIAKASGLNKNINYAVASVFDLPFEAQSFDCIISVFSPFAMQEYLRTLKADGLLVVASPAPKHLWELKEILYAERAEEKEKVAQWDGWTQVERVRLTYAISLQCNQDIVNLFEMTPYFYTTTQDKKQRLDAVTQGEFTLDFFVTVLKKATF